MNGMLKTSAIDLLLRTVGDSVVKHEPNINNIGSNAISIMLNRLFFGMPLFTLVMNEMKNREPIDYKYGSVISGELTNVISLTISELLISHNIHANEIIKRSLLYTFLEYIASEMYIKNITVNNNPNDPMCPEDPPVEDPPVQDPPVQDHGPTYPDPEWGGVLGLYLPPYTTICKIPPENGGCMLNNDMNKNETQQNVLKQPVLKLSQNDIIRNTIPEIQSYMSRNRNIKL